MKVQKPRRVSRTFTQKLVAKPERVFPLLCPVREVDWASDWDPIDVWSDSGLVEVDCVFTTPADPEPAVWYVSRHEPDRGFVEMIKITPGLTACRLSIQLTATEAGSRAAVTYTHTSLGPKGDAFVADFTESFYETMMREWEAQINRYLNTGPGLAYAEG